MDIEPLGTLDPSRDLVVQPLNNSRIYSGSDDLHDPSEMPLTVLPGFNISDILDLDVHVIRFFSYDSAMAILRFHNFLSAIMR